MKVWGRALDLLLAGVNADVEYVAAAQNHVTVVCGGRVTTVFRSAFKYDVHVTIGVNHSPSVLNIILQSYVYFRV